MLKMCGQFLQQNVILVENQLLYIKHQNNFDRILALIDFINDFKLKTGSVV